VVDPQVVRHLPEDMMAEWRIDRDQQTATLVAPPALVPKLTLPLTPMLGCFGVAPARRQAISTATSGPYGGNMDYRGFTTGVTAYFPVFVPGALFHLGDGHGLQGDGELLGTGIETSFDVQFTVRLVKAGQQTWPRGENADYIFTIGNGRPLDQALQFATSEMRVWLMQEFEWDERSVCILLGQCVEYDIANVYNPAYTIVCKVPKSLLHIQDSGAINPVTYE
ncbi:MAG: acetamidase, partial [Chloroflexi bacterium]